MHIFTNYFSFLNFVLNSALCFFSKGVSIASDSIINSMSRSPRSLDKLLLIHYTAFSTGLLLKLTTFCRHNLLILLYLSLVWEHLEEETISVIILYPVPDTLLGQYKGLKYICWAGSLLKLQLICLSMLVIYVSLHS